MKFKDILTDRAQRVDEKNEAIRLVMFAPRVTVTKISKNGSFYVLSAGYSKISVPVWARYLNASERSYLALSENTMDYVLQSYH